MKTRNEAALEKFVAGYNCAQSVLYAYGPDLGLDGETSLKVATGLGAGMGRRGEVCGAVTGARQDRSATEETYRKTLDLMARFEQRHGSCLCRVLLDGCDLRTEEGQQHFKERDLLHKTCLGCVSSVVEILAQIVDVPETRAGSASQNRA